MINNVEQLYNDNKLLVRAMDYPFLQRNNSTLEYDCSTWINEFALLKNECLSSASTTLIVPNIGINTYKGIGFLINSDLANCFHISISDSVSSGDINRGDFNANKADFNIIEELANYIKENNWTIMNEVNIVANLDAVEGLFINKCRNQERLLAMILIIQKCLKHFIDIEYPIYLYDSHNGTLEKLEITQELEDNILSNLKTKTISYWPEDYDEPFIESLDNLRSKKL